MLTGYSYYYSVRGDVETCKVLEAGHRWLLVIMMLPRRRPRCDWQLPSFAMVIIKTSRLR